MCAVHNKQARLQTSLDNEIDECCKLSENDQEDDDSIVKVLPYLTGIYLVFMIWRYLSIFLYAVFATECFFRAKVATLRCENFSVFPFPTLFEIAWQTSSSINSVICIAVLQRLPQFPGFLVIRRKLVRIARFWSLLFQLFVVITFNVILLLHEHLLVISVVEFGFIFDEVSVTAVVCLWNFVPAPNSENASKSFQFCYYFTLVAFFLENLYLFILMSSQAALDITGIHEFENRPPSLQAVGIIMNATEATFYFAIMKFFWNKIFEHSADLFEKETF